METPPRLRLAPRLSTQGKASIGYRKPPRQGKTRGLSTKPTGDSLARDGAETPMSQAALSGPQVPRLHCYERNKEDRRPQNHREKSLQQVHLTFLLVSLPNPLLRQGPADKQIEGKA